MSKIFLCFITLLCLSAFPLPSSATEAIPQEGLKTRFISVCGKDTTHIEWIETAADKLRKLRITIASQITEYLSDNHMVTHKCHIIDKHQGTDIHITLQDGVYHLIGTYKTKPYSHTVKSEGHPWFQNIAYSLAETLHSATSPGVTNGFTFECFRPDNLEFQIMKATPEGISEFEGQPSSVVRIRPTGFFSRIWSCRYFLDHTFNRYIGYRGTHGGPGTPETVIFRLP